MNWQINDDLFKINLYNKMRPYYSSYKKIKHVFEPEILHLKSTSEIPHQERSSSTSQNKNQRYWKSNQH